MQERLSGGFINDVYRLNGKVKKHFSKDFAVGQEGTKREAREAYSLTRFGGDLAPRFLGVDSDGNLLQEFIQGEILENNAVVGKKIPFFKIGETLRKIHHPVARNPIYLGKDFINRLDRDYQKASRLLDFLGLEINISPDWQDVFSFGTVRVHRDFWMGNIIQTEEDLITIDWEFSGIGSPYEDFVIVDLWIVREYEKTYGNDVDKIWQGYGRIPDKRNIGEFLKARCVNFLSTTSIESYLSEPEDGFYHNKVSVLKSLALE